MIRDLDTLDRRADALVDGHARLLRDLVAMRAAHGLTQAEVAERMGVSQPTVAAFERYDANPTLSTLRRYALAVEARMETAVIAECAADAPPAAPGSAEAQPVTSRPAR